MNTNSQLVIEKMRSIDKVFADTGRFKPALLKQASQELNLPPQYAILKDCEKIGFGLYNLDYNKSGDTKQHPQQPETKIELVAISAMNKAPDASQKHKPTVPIADPDYVPFGAYREVEKIVKSQIFYPLYITGHSGNGKSSQVIQICAKNDRQLVRLNFTKQTDEEKLIGCKSLKNGDIVIEEGPVLNAMRSGAILLCEEIDAADSNVILTLQSILEGKPFYFALTGEVIQPAKGFNIIATANTKGKGSDSGRYIGTNILNEAFLDRFGETIEQDYPPQKVELQMVLNWMRRHAGAEDAVFAQELVKWADSIRKVFDDGAIDDVISTRRLEHIVKSWTIFKDRKRAIERCTSRFDPSTKAAFIELFEKITTEELNAMPEQAMAA